MRDAHDAELQTYAKNIQNERERQRQRMRERLEAKRKRSQDGKKQFNSYPEPPRSEDAYLGAKESSALQASNDAFAQLMSM